MAEAGTDRGNCYFVTYLSKGPLGSPLAEEAKADYENLRYLADRISSTAKYEVVKPIATGLSPAYRGYRYPFFTMPFVSDKGELHVDLTGVGQNYALIPYFRFAYPLDRSMQVESERQANLGPKKMLKWVRHNRHKYADARRFLIDMYHSEGGRHIYQQRNDLLVGNALIYIASGGYFPGKFSVNAGDWMARFPREGGLDLTLVTVRGGFKGPYGFDGWVKRMKDHVEPYYPVHDDSTYTTFPLFYGVTDEEFADAYRLAEALL